MSTQISYQDKVRFRTSDYKYISSPGEGYHFTLIDHFDDSCVFRLREYNYDNNDLFCYSGNQNADTIDCNMNFRLLRENLDMMFQVVSVDIDNAKGFGPNALYNGVNWDAADDFETFLPFDPDNYDNDGPIYDGSKILIRNMRGSASNDLQKFWRDWGQRFIALGLRDPQKTVQYEHYVDLAIQESHAERMYVIAADLPDYGSIVGAWGPSIDYATVFYIEIVN